MKKFYVIGTGLMILIVLFHMFYMVGGLSGMILNEDLAINLGYTLMSLAILHGTYGLVKWIKVLLNQRKLKKTGQSVISLVRMSARAITLLQRITGVMVVILIVPHSFIKIMFAGNVLLIVDALFVVALILHLLIGLPKLLVSTGLLSGKFEGKHSRIFGGKGNV